VEVGETVYALGSPLGLEDTFSNGMISSTNRVDGGQTFLQTTASISSGSSGGALLNEYGQVIGVTAASYTSGQSLNLAIPIDCIKSVDFTKTGDTYASVQQKLYGSSSTTTTKASYYSQFPDVPDFGTSLGVSLAGTTKESGYTIYMYRASDVVSAGLASTYEKSYTQLLTNSGYSYVTEKSTTSYDMKLYYRSASSRYIYFGLMVVSGTTYVMVMIY
jgi:hypothetical protein